MRKIFIFVSVASLLAIGVGSWHQLSFIWLFLLIIPIITIGCFDMMQEKRAIRRNFPVVGHFRYFFEAIRPEINQYFVESDTDGMPFSRVIRSIVYQRAKAVQDAVPFGTKLDVHAVGYQWVNHSLAPKDVDVTQLRVRIGSRLCTKPYDASVFNISAMSYGALSRNAILALNEGARLGGFFHDTGEGGLSHHHLKPGGDLTWEIGTGYFSCRSKDGRLDEGKFREKAVLSQVKMIEIKLSQGAKPGHGGILPASKLTREIAEIRGVPMGHDVISPAAHKEFANPIQLLTFVQRLREMAGGKPVGIKLCLGKRREFIAIGKAMVATKIVPDFIVIDGGEGGTGAAPLEFSNHVGTPLKDALVFIHNCLVGFDLRKEIKILVAGKVVTGFDIVDKMALGADICNSARGMMLALGCIQALRCHSNTCPTGVATQNPELERGLVVRDKAQRVFQYHKNTVKSLAELVGAMGLSHTSQIKPWHILTRVSRTETKHYGELYPFLEPGAFLAKTIHPSFARAFNAARPDSWASSQDLMLAEVGAG